jgi:OPA family hexose phosphate transport protein UhpT-like MFS transporter
MNNFLKINYPEKKDIKLSEQRSLWLKEFLKAFTVVFISYMAMYLIRNNLKAAQPALKEAGLTTTQLGQIGVAFSVTYGLGKTIVGYWADGKNSKRIVSLLLIGSSISVMLMGFVLLGLEPAQLVKGAKVSANSTQIVGFMMILWGISGFFQSAGGPSSYATITKWTPLSKRGRWLGFWNASHNVGGAIAGGLALFMATKLFNGNVAGYFIGPAVIALAIGFGFLFFGVDSPEELGWERSENIFEEPIERENIEAEKLTKIEIFQKYVLTNKWVWILATANIGVYIVRIGIDNWSSLYTTEQLGFKKDDAVATLFWFEMGALGASLIWGSLSDLAGGRRGLLAAIAMFLVTFAIVAYQSQTSVAGVNISLFVIGILIFGPQLLIGVSLTGFVPKAGTAVANGITGTFGYLIGDSFAKIGLAQIADPNQNGLHLFGLTTLKGWNSTFTVMYAAIVFTVILLLFVAVAEEKKLRELKKAKAKMAAKA